MIKCYHKSCKKCGSSQTKKDGKRKGKQSYRCKCCRHVRTSKSRRKEIMKKKLYDDFSCHKQTYAELSTKYAYGVKTIQKYLDSFSYKIIPPKPNTLGIILLIDTTYFGRHWGVIVFKDARTKQVLHHIIVHYETNDSYKKGIQKLQDEGRKILAIVCDGKKGLLGSFPSVPTQMCHFHQSSIIRRYITKKPILDANKELKNLVDWLHRTDRESFRLGLEKRHNKYKEFIQEKAVNTKGKTYYVHRRTRSAYYSLKRNLPYLFTYLDYLKEIDIPNTTNGLEGLFSHLKAKVKLHRGLKKERKIKLITYLLYHQS